MTKIDYQDDFVGAFSRQHLFSSTGILNGLGLTSIRAVALKSIAMGDFFHVVVGFLCPPLK